MSRSYDGPEIDDFRDPAWGQERHRSSRGGTRGISNDWRNQASVRLKLQKLREAEAESDQLSAQSREHVEASRTTLSQQARELPILAERDRARYADHDQSYSLRPSEILTLTDVGKFRVVRVEDLAKFNYAEDRPRMENDLRNLKEQELVVERGTSVLKKESRQVLTLTKQGHRLIRKHSFAPDDQAIYSGLAKPKEADHDADLYRMYHKAADEIERKGGRVLRVQLDYELKEKLYQRLGRVQARDGGETQRLKESFAIPDKISSAQGCRTAPHKRKRGQSRSASDRRPIGQALQKQRTAQQSSFNTTNSRNITECLDGAPVGRFQAFSRSNS